MTTEMPEYLNTFPTLRRLLKLQGIMSLRELGRQARIDASLLCGKLQAEHKWSLDEAFRIANVLGCRTEGDIAKVLKELNKNGYESKRK